MTYYTQILQAASAALLGYILLHIYRTHRSSNAFQAFARANNCQPPVFSPSRLPWGLDRIYKIFTFKGGDFLDDFIFARFKGEGRWTLVSSAFGGELSIMTAEPRNVQAVLATQFADFGVGKRRYQQFGPLLGYGTFTADGAMWEHSRAILRPQFSRENINDLEAAERHIQRLFQALQVTSEDGWTERTDLAPLFLRFMLDAATEWLFGKSVESQLAALVTAGPKEDVDVLPSTDLGRLERSFDGAFRIAQETLARRVRSQGLYWLFNSRKFRNACAVCHTWADHFVAQALKNKQARPHEIKTISSPPREAFMNPETKDADQAKPKYSVLSEMLELTSDPLLLRSQSIQLLLAGRDSTATLLSFIFLELARHPPIFASLRAEILSAFGPDPSSTPNPPRSPHDPLTFTTLKSLPLLQSILHETLRLYPLLPLNNRIAQRRTTLPLGGGPLGASPLAIPANTVVTFSAYVMHRRRDIWGPDAEEWRPGRWEGRKLGWEYVPFNGGPRTCLGQQFARTMAAFVVVRMVQRWERVELVGEKGEGVRKMVGLTLAPAEGVRVRLKRARAA